MRSVHAGMARMWVSAVALVALIVVATGQDATVTNTISLLVGGFQGAAVNRTAVASVAVSQARAHIL